MRISWEEVAGILLVFATLFGFYHKFVMDNIILDKIENHRATRLAILAIVEEKLLISDANLMKLINQMRMDLERSDKDVLREVNRTRLEVQASKTNYSVRMAKRKEEIAALYALIYLIEESYVDAITEVSYNLSALDLKLVEFIIHYNKFNKEKTYDYIDRTQHQQKKHEEYVKKIFSGGRKEAAKQALKKKKEESTGSNSGFINKDTEGGRD